MFLINGHKQESLAVSDRATQFGDGCFTTARVIDGKVSLLSAHIQRLQDACQRLMIILSQLSTEKVKTLATLVLKYNPAVMALCGAMLESIGADKSLTDKIAASLNPVTEYKIPVSEAVLANKNKWRIK